MLGQQLLIAEELCLAGYAKEQLPSVRRAHAALVQLDWTATPQSDSKAEQAEYEPLREALIIYDVQLRSAPRAQVREAQLAILGRLNKHLDEHEWV
ncbi:hypothetical protein [Caballeronia novacaledonica]|nr:hypothetical protein [Caballeronia novacaledonica]